VGTGNLVLSAVESNQLNDGAVTLSKLNPGAVIAAEFYT
jgi:hypothetical protein